MRFAAQNCFLSLWLRLSQFDHPQLLGLLTDFSFFHVITKRMNFVVLILQIMHMHGMFFYLILC